MSLSGAPMSIADDGVLGPQLVGVLRALQEEVRNAQDVAIQLQQERDDALTRAQQAEAALVAKHGGEPVALLHELDAARAEVDLRTDERNRFADQYDAANQRITGMQREIDTLRALLSSALPYVLWGWGPERNAASYEAGRNLALAAPELAAQIRKHVRREEGS